VWGVPEKVTIEEMTAPLKTRKWLRRIALYALIGLGVWWGLCAFVAFGFVHPVRFAVRHTPAEAGMKFENVKFPSRKDNLTLCGWWIPARKPKGALALFHGYPGNRGDLIRHAAFLHKAGYSLLLFDFRALGDSDGTMSTIGYREVDDAEAALDYLEARPEVKGLPIGVVGTSMGAAVALQTAARRPEVRAVIADSSYASLDRAVDQRFRAYLGNACPVVSGPVQFCGEQYMGVRTATVAPLEAVAKLGERPVFFIHGTADIVIRPEDSQLLYDRKPGAKQLWMVEGAGHIRGLKVAGEKYRQRVVAFLAQNMQ
jgi:pimeloyl-ACP methyl ester carboxylesterase